MTFHLTAESTMIEIVLEAFDQLGGGAKLGNVYPVVESLFRELGREIPARLDEQVRQTIYLYCSGSPNFSTNKALFESIGYGEYRVHRPTLDELA
jgi:hypothetical protein